MKRAATQVLVTLKPHVIEQIEVRMRTAAEIAERAAERRAQEAHRRATLPICVCCDQPRESRDFIKRADGSPSETCLRCVSRTAEWNGKLSTEPHLARMKAINRRLIRECRYAG